MSKIEVEYGTFANVDINYYIEKAHAERADYIAGLFRKAFFMKSKKGNKARVSYKLQQSPAH